MQVSKTQTIRLANVMGMDIDNSQDQIGILDALTSVSDIDAFIEWMRANRDTVEYSNRREKLTILHNRYKRTTDDIPSTLLKAFSREIADKFKAAIQILRDNEEIFTERGLHGLKGDKVQYFTNKEIVLLDEVGSLNRLISLYEMNSLYDALYEASVKKTIAAKTQTVLTDGEKKVKALMGSMK